jgi:hypothetical protein
MRRERCTGFGSMTFGLAVQKFLNIDWDMCRKAFGDIHLGMIQSKEYLPGDKCFNHIYMVILCNIATRAHDASGWTRYYKQASKQANITV